MERFDIPLVEWLGETDSVTSDLKAGRRTFQQRHIQALIEGLRAEFAAPTLGRVGRRLRADRSLSWGRGDEFRLLWLFVFGGEPAEPEITDAHFLKGEFSLGGWRQEARVCAFVPDGYDPALITASFDKAPLRLPEDPVHRAAFTALAEQEQSAIVATGAWNGAGATLSHIRLSRDDTFESPLVTLRLKPSDYVRRRTTRSLFSEHLTEDERRSILDTIPQGVQEPYCGGFGVVLSVITADRKLLFFRRSSATGGDHGTYDCTVVEGMNWEKDQDEDGQPSVTRNALRGLYEEAGLKEHADRLQSLIHFHGVVCRSRFYEWALYGALDLSQTAYTATAWADGYAAAPRRRGKATAVRHQHKELGDSFGMAQDSFEFAEYVAVDFTLPDVVRFLATRPMSDYSFISAIMTLRSVLNVSPADIARELSHYQQPNGHIQGARR